MTFTARLGTSSSQLGAIELGSTGGQAYSDTITLSSTNACAVSDGGTAIVGDVTFHVTNTYADSGIMTVEIGLTFSSTNSYITDGSVGTIYNDVVTLATTAGYTPSPGGPTVFTVAASNGLGLRQDLTRHMLFRRWPSSIVRLKQKVTRKTVLHFAPTTAIVFSQGFYKYGYATNVLTLSHWASWTKPVFKFSQWLRFKQAISFQLIGNPVIVQSTGIVHSVQAKLTLSVGASSHASFSQAVALLKYGNANSRFAPFHQLNVIRLVPSVASNNLAINHQVVCNIVKNLSVSNTIAFVQGETKQWAVGETYFVPPRAVKVVRFCILKTANSVVVLRPPNLSDTENYDPDLTIKHAVTGELYTYVRDSEVYKLSYTWSLDRNKALELRQFLINNFASVITIENWKGEVWKVYVMAVPNLTGKMIAERTDVTIEFEGVKISG